MNNLVKIECTNLRGLEAATRDFNSLSEFFKSKFLEIEEREKRLQLLERNNSNAEKTYIQLNIGLFEYNFNMPRYYFYFLLSYKGGKKFATNKNNLMDQSLYFKKLIETGLEGKYVPLS